MPDDPSTSDASHCPRCGAVRSASARQCWLCGLNLPPSAGRDGGPPIAPALPPSLTPTSERGFSLASLMMFVTLASVVLGISTIAPGIGIPLGLIALFAWARTAIVIRRRKRHRLETTFGEKAELFAASLGVVILAGVATAVAFFGSCFAGFWAGAGAGSALGASDYAPLGWGFATGGLIGAVVGLWVFYLLMKAMKPKD